MGPKTQAALKDYQEKKGLQASGKLDQQTIAALGVEEGASASTGSTSEQKEPEQKQPEQKPKY
jgi:peptidoglycan hydrolase-like protein with peptidoglycan-binding domain